MASNIETLLFPTAKAWDSWLAKNHDKSPGLWLRIAKKDSGLESVSYPEALETALCYGWIDGQKKAHDADSWLQKFTPRGPRSVWSQINRDKALALIEKKKMKPAGLLAIEHAKQTGRWDAAYASQSKMTVPEDLEEALNKNKKAKAFFATLDSANRYSILFRLHDAKKAETRLKRLQQFISMLEKGEKIHP
jgi:uncharacterized protein YdeI (YjbR/CyaY-like superfamily)